jgi:hypothetical protein
VALADREPLPGLVELDRGLSGLRAAPIPVG